MDWPEGGAVRRQEEFFRETGEGAVGVGWQGDRLAFRGGGMGASASAAVKAGHCAETPP